ncbi:MAG: M28 family peptidase, partial [Verrucomicrobia bacterium]|nr:M28 family peptidase [Verrucomicrobiota bacterium]
MVRVLRHAMTLGMFLVVAAAAGADTAAPLLIHVDTDEQAAAADLVEAGCPPVRLLDGYMLAWADSASLHRARAAALPVTFLAVRRDDRGYAAVYAAGRDRARSAPPLERYGEILFRGSRTAVLAYPPAMLDSVLDAYEIVPILDRPIRLPDSAARSPALLPEDPDPLVASLVAAVDVDTLLGFVRRLQNLGSRRSTHPGGVEASGILAERFRSFGLEDVTFLDYNDWCDDVVAVQPGLGEPDEIYVVGAHYDSYSRAGLEPGADDNATGTAAVVEAARLLSAWPFEATIVYVAFSGEEQGLHGSEAYAAWAVGGGLDIRGMLNLDMIGYLRGGDGADLDLITNEPSRWLLEQTVAAGGLYLPGHPVVEGFLTAGDSDHSSFWNYGYPAILFHEDSIDPSPYIHTSQDIIGVSVNAPEFMERNTQVLVATLASLARPVRVRIIHARLDDPPTWQNGYTVRARIQSVAPVPPESVQVRYRVDEGPFLSLPMRPLPDPNEFEAVLPRQAPGATIAYMIRARDIEGRVGTEPPRAPADLHFFRVGLAVRFAEEFDLEGGWTVGAPGDSATSGVWVRAVPVGTGAQSDTDADADPAGFCFVTGNGEPGGEIGGADVDGGRTTLTSPEIDLEGFLDVGLSYAYWFVDETNPDDALRVYISNDDGGSWILLDEIREGDRRWRRATIGGIDSLLAPTDRMRLRFV